MTTSWDSLRLGDCDGPVSAELVIVDGSTCRGSEAAVEKAVAALSIVSLGAQAGAFLDLPAAASDQPRLLVLRGRAEASPGTDWIWAGAHLWAAMRQLGLDMVRLPAASDLGGESRLADMLEGAIGHSFALRIGGAEYAARRGGLVVASEDRPVAERKMREADAINRARAWTDQPANLLTPPAFAQEAGAVLGALGATIRLFGPQELKAMGANLLHAVGRGSEHGAHLFVAEWRGDPDREEWDALLLGKGVTFDGGGLNLKPRPIISRMKLDKAGGAAVLGAMEMAIGRAAGTNIVAIVPMAENSIDALAYRPGDVLTSLSGLTVEVGDTDYEGRLALADAMTHGLRTYRPAWAIDIATLTTVMMSTFYEDYAGLFTTDEALCRDLIAAGEDSGDRLWRFPLDKGQDYIVASDIADLVNIGAPGGFGVNSGSPAAGAKFLERFAGDARWAHIDMASVAVASRPTARHGKGAIGYGVRLLDQWLRSIEVNRS